MIFVKAVDIYLVSTALIFVFAVISFNIEAIKCLLCSVYTSKRKDLLFIHANYVNYCNRLEIQALFKARALIALLHTYHFNLFLCHLFILTNFVHAYVL